MFNHRVRQFANSISRALTQHTWSFQRRLIAVFIGLFLIFIWALVFFAVTVLKSQFEQVLAAQQFAATLHFAAELERNLTERTLSLTRIAENFPSELQPEALNGFLSEKKIVHALFSAGLFVIDLDGKSIAEYPLVAGRKDIHYGDRDYFLKVVASRTSWIGIPIVGRALKRPLLPIAVPVFDGNNRLRAVLVGLTDLMSNNFIATHSDPAMSGNGEFLVVSARDKVIIAATDQRRVLGAAPPPGVNPMFDRFLAGFEGSGIARGADGNPKLFSGKYLPIAQWIVIAALPTAVAFGPVKQMQHYLVVIALVMTLAAIFIVQWMARRLLAPLESASNAMQEMIDGETALVALPVERMDEIGIMIGNFNRLVQERQRHEAVLRDLSAHMESAREEERKRIAREVHDELGQALTVLRMDVSLLRLHFGGQSPALMERILAMKEGVDRTIRIMRHVTSTLRPVALDLGLISGLEWLVEEFTHHAGIDCQLQASGCDEVVLDDGRATALFRIVQESLTNVVKHAAASAVVVSIRIEDNRSICVKISDNGKGFVPGGARKAGSFGLIGMRERALMLHGKVDIDSTPGTGTRVEVCIPLTRH